MTWRTVAVCVTPFAVFAIAVIAGRILGGTTICEHCDDTGKLWINEYPQRLAFCNFCMLGQQYEKSAGRLYGPGSESNR